MFLLLYVPQVTMNDFKRHFLGSKFLGSAIQSNFTMRLSKFPLTSNASVLLLFTLNQTISIPCIVFNYFSIILTLICDKLSIEFYVRVQRIYPQAVVRDIYQTDSNDLSLIRVYFFILFLKQFNYSSKLTIPIKLVKQFYILLLSTLPPYGLSQTEQQIQLENIYVSAGRVCTDNIILYVIVNSKIC